MENNTTPTVPTNGGNEKKIPIIAFPFQTHTGRPKQRITLRIRQPQIPAVRPSLEDEWIEHENRIEELDHFGERMDAFSVILLGELEREVLMRKIGSKMSMQQIADELKITVPRAMAALKRAKSRINAFRQFLKLWR